MLHWKMNLLAEIKDLSICVITVYMVPTISYIINDPQDAVFNIAKFTAYAVSSFVHFPWRGLTRILQEQRTFHGSRTIDR